MGTQNGNEDLIIEPVNESTDPVISEDDTTEANLQEGTSLRDLSDEPEGELTDSDLNENEEE